MVDLSPDQRRLIQDIAGRFGVGEIRVFGSTARGSAGPESDLDLLVRFDVKATLLTVIGFKQAIESALNRKVDVVEEGGLSPFLAPRILAEAVPL